MRASRRPPATASSRSSRPSSPEPPGRRSSPPHRPSCPDSDHPRGGAGPSDGRPPGDQGSVRSSPLGSSADSSYPVRGGGVEPGIGLRSLRRWTVTASPGAYPRGRHDRPCSASPSRLNRAACELSTSSKASCSPRSGGWPRGRDVGSGDGRRPLQSGTSRAIDGTVDRGTLPGWAGRVLRFVVEQAPIEWLLNQLPFWALARPPPF